MRGLRHLKAARASEYSVSASAKQLMPCHCGRLAMSLWHAIVAGWQCKNRHVRSCMYKKQGTCRVTGAHVVV